MPRMRTGRAGGRFIPSTGDLHSSDLSQAKAAVSLLNTGDMYYNMNGSGSGLNPSAPIGWAGLMAIGGAALSGKTLVGLTDTFPLVTLNLTGQSSPIIFIPRDTGNPPVFDQLSISSVGDITLRQLMLASSAWTANASNTPCIQPRGTNGNIILDRNVIKGNYRGDITASIDVLNDLPEYACVAAQMTGASGAASVTSFSIPHPYVGDLLVPGTYPLTLQETLGSGFSATMTVTLTTIGGRTGNFITSTNLISGGSGYTNTRHEANRITWPGQHRLTDYLPWGWQYFDGFTSVANLTVTDNTFADLGEGMKSSPPLNSLVITGNTLHRMYGSGFSIGMAGNTVPPASTKINFNFFDQCGFYDSEDAGNPHGDAVHLFLNDNSVPNTPSDWKNPELSANVILGHDARGCDIGFLIGQHPASGVTFDAPRMVGNLMAGDVAASFIDFDTLRDGYIFVNTGVRFDTTNPLNVNTLNVSVPSLSTSTLAFGKSFVSKNISGAFTLPNANVVDPGDNIGTGLNGATVSYASIFAHSTALRNSVATALAAYVPIGIAAGRGAGGIAGYIDYDAQTIDRTKEPTFVQFDSLVNQATSTSVGSAWCRILGGPGTQPYSVAGGTVQFADDATGTNATAASAAGNVVIPSSGRWAKVTQTTSSSGSTTTTASLTLNGYTYTFKAKTQSVLSFAAVSNQASAYSTAPTPTVETGLKRAIFAFQIQLNALVSLADIFSDNLANFRVWLPSTTAYRMQFVSGGVTHRTTVTPSLLVETHIIAIDFTQTVAANVSKWFLNGNNIAQAASSTADVTGTKTFTSQGLINSTLGMFAKPDGTLVNNMKLGFFWMHWGTGAPGSGAAGLETMPDISDSAVQDLFTADRINLTDGSGVLGVQPKYFLTGSAAAWNANLANKGSLGLTMTKIAGTYA